MALDLDKLLDDNTDKIEKVSDKDKESILSGSDKETVGSKETVSTSGSDKKKKAPKKKARPRGGNSPVIGDNGLMLAEGDNAKFMEVNLALFSMPNIDLNDVEQVQARIAEFFTLYTSRDMKPTVAGLGLALNGMDRRRLWEIKTDTISSTREINELPPEVKDTIKKAYKIMENLWEQYMNSGKVNPVAGIFLGKNNFGYQDKTEYVLTPNQQSDNDYDADEIRDRYIAADQQKRLSDNSTSSETESD